MTKEMAWARDEVKLFSCHSGVRRCATLKTFSCGWVSSYRGPDGSITMHSGVHHLFPAVMDCFLASGLLPWSGGRNNELEVKEKTSR